MMNTQQFTPVLDGRKRKVRSLWQRGDMYYARIKIAYPGGGFSQDFLFWSQAASESKEVEWEWRLALNNKGLEFIDPVPLEDPRQVPPPAELSSLHFGDKWISFKNTTGQ